MSHVTPADIPHLLNEGEVHRITRIPLSTLRNWRCLGRELPFIKMGRSVFYDRKDVLDYIAQNRRVPSVRAS